MQITTLSNLLLLTTLTLFSACSSKTVVPQQKQKKETTAKIEIKSVPSVIGIQTGSYISSLPFAKTYPIETEREEMVSSYNQNIVYEDYQEEIQRLTPIYQNYQNYQEEEKEEVRNYCLPTQRLAFRNDIPQKKRQVESDAKRLLGIKYVWGATGPFTYDCSGFTQKVYRDVGINIPRVSRDQAKVGQYVTYNNLRKGDMVFFDTKKKRTGKVTHVGIYLGNNNFIHASSGAKKIVIFNFNEKPFYKKRFLWGRRVIQNRHLASL